MNILITLLPERATERIEIVLKHLRIAEAIEFCRWACEFLQEWKIPGEEDLAILESRARVLAP
jgi:hypothetical protein